MWLRSTMSDATASGPEDSQIRTASITEQAQPAPSPK